MTGYMLACLPVLLVLVCACAVARIATVRGWRPRRAQLSYYAVAFVAGLGAEAAIRRWLPATPRLLSGWVFSGVAVLAWEALRLGRLAPRSDEKTQPSAPH